MNAALDARKKAYPQEGAVEPRAVAIRFGGIHVVEKQIDKAFVSPEDEMYPEHLSLM